MPSIPEVSRVLDYAFDQLCQGQAHDTYVSVSCSWTNPAGRLISMHISVGDTDEDEDAPAMDVDVERPIIRPIPALPETTR